MLHEFTNINCCLNKSDVDFPSKIDMVGHILTLVKSMENRSLPGVLRRLVDANVIEEAKARDFLVEAQKANKPVYRYLLEKKLVDSYQVTLATAAEFGMACFDARSLDMNLAPVKLLDEEWILKNKILPLSKRGQRLYVGVSDPTLTKQIDEIKFKTRLMCEPVLVEAAWLNSAIEAALHNTQDFNAEDGEEYDLDIDISDSEIGQDQGIDVNSTEDAPVVKFVNKMLMDAIRRGASDIHFEPYESDYRVRLRMDGLLKTVSRVPPKLQNRISARLKVMASLDIAERRVPQDGRIKLNLSKTKQMDFRVSTLPTLFGEKVVLRILDGGAAKLGIDKLGYEDAQRDMYIKALANPYGMILVTGPTGSGKTVSLYTGLNILNTDERNISTAEDPVEIRVPGINQVQVNPKKGMTFAAALKSFLRQDPDVIMVGEIRDLETAEIAVKAAQTGHLVLSTLHTNDAPQTISRLMNMGIAPYNITSSVTLVIAQRLARRLCPKCKVLTNLPAASLTAAGFTGDEISQGLQIYEAKPSGCDECNDGYKGRVGIYQVMPMTEDIQEIVLQGGNALQIAEAAERSGVPDLRSSALKKVKDGVLGLTEADRVTKS